jgi:pimeloyl-ACP methyl ester carboxylesterase
LNWRRIRRVVRRVWITCGLLFTAWMIWSFQSHGLPADTFASDAQVSVAHGAGSWRFLPLADVRSAGLVFLPGGMVDPRAYGPIARELASAGYPVAIVELPLRMARTPEHEQTVLGRARDAQAALGGELGWVLAGHSRGAAIATRLIEHEASAFRAVALIGTTHPQNDLSALPLPVVKIGGTRDCVAPRDRSEAAAANLPAETEWVWIEGANHAQFGWYGSQLGDCSASISRAEQQAELLAAVRGLLERVEGRSGTGS